MSYQSNPQLQASGHLPTSELLDRAEANMPLSHNTSKWKPKPKATGPIVIGFSSTPAPMSEEEKARARADAIIPLMDLR